ncbi:MAG: ATP synthase F1 subunit gamma [Bacteroidetes bacterium]|nr:MAG: ATP synthase F1 subunit gamma [Bacteroidota bacterium]
MPSLKEVRNRITSTISTQQITSAMKMVSAAKLRRAQDAIIQLRPYAGKLKDILSNITSSADSSSGGDFAKKKPVKNVLLVVITSNRGLCGAFNSNVIKLASRTVREKYAEQKKAGNVQVLAIGKKAADFFRKANYKIFSNNSELLNGLNYENTSVVAETIMKKFAIGEFDAVELFYNQFKNAASQNLTSEQYLPVAAPAQDKNAKKTTIDYIYEPDKEEIVKELIPKALRIQLYKALLDSYAAEHGARMTSMHKATDNANEILRDLRLTYNKARQATITKEILEIVGGAEALKN